MRFPNTGFIGDGLGIDVEGLMDVAENVPGSNLIDFISSKLPGSMDSTRDDRSEKTTVLNFLQKVKEYWLWTHIGKKETWRSLSHIERK